MPVKVKISICDVVVEAELNDTSIAKAIVQALPLKFTGNYWGDEIYGTIPVKKKATKTVEVIDEPGTLGYWDIGSAFCIFWGRTPVSRGDEIRPASPVAVIGKVTSGLQELIDSHPQLGRITIEKLK